MRISYEGKWGESRIFGKKGLYFCLYLLAPGESGLQLATPVSRSWLGR
jgi:hypothetical protein